MPDDPPFKEIGDFFREVRLLNGHKKIEPFAMGALKLKGGEHLGRIESGKRLPGPETLLALLPFVLAVERKPSRLIYLWLEAQGLSAYVQEIRRKPAKKATEEKKG